MNQSKDYKLSEQEQEELNILKYQKQSLHKLNSQTDDLLSGLDSPITQSEEILDRYGRKPNKVVVQQGRPNISKKRPVLRSWDEIVLEAEESIDKPALMTDVLSLDEIQLIEQKLSFLHGDFEAIHKLDKLDWAICGVAGILAALVDVFLIQMPKHPGFLGGESSEGGPLANWIREKVNQSFSPEEIRKLERKNWVPYDPAHSANLSQRVEGLGAGTHRFQSLGHDPILGFIFGVKDILMGTFTAIDKNGSLIVQNVGITDSSIIGMNLFDAIGRVFGHLKSDIATSRGLPVPLMPLFQFLQFGEVGKQGYTVGEVTRGMYRSNYDFRHFLAMSITPLLIEVIVRSGYFAKRMYEGHKLTDAIPLNLPLSKRQPKLQTMLFSAHLIATAANAGKVVIGQNPLMINFPQWIAFFRYAIPQLKWGLLDKENERFQYIQQRIDADWQVIDRDLEATWNLVGMEPIFLI